MPQQGPADKGGEQVDAGARERILGKFSTQHGTAGLSAARGIDEPVQHEGPPSEQTRSGSVSNWRVTQEVSEYGRIIAEGYAADIEEMDER
jgi:hypothetical protein